MAKPDEAHRMTDAELADLEKRIGRIYGEAAKDVQGKVDKYFQQFAKRDAEQKTLLDAGEITAEEYKQWRLAQMGRGERFQSLQKGLAERMTQANEVATKYINDATPGVYSLNRNYGAYTIEKYAGNVGFDLWDEQTVKRLIVEQPQLMPNYPQEKAVKRGIDLKYGQQQVTKQVTTGILQGESIKDISDRLTWNIPEMNRNSAIRAARTAVTGAQNAGRQDSYEAAEEMGIELEREWVATLDNRTRHTHAELDGQVVGVDEQFEVEGYKIMYPGDPDAVPEMVYNCRCTTIARVKNVPTALKRRARDEDSGRGKVIENMTFKEWQKMKEEEE